MTHEYTEDETPAQPTATGPQSSRERRAQSARVWQQMQYMSADREPGYADEPAQDGD